ncbi:MAG: class I SAM-dependent methyltransferase [Verrucomicrobia bacterium]|nr:class I SAM-dependent methyltransferase [Verrucomicrobiota bacterium]
MFKYFVISIIFLSGISFESTASIASLQFRAAQPPEQPADIASGKRAFNSAAELGLFFEMLKQSYPITTVIETGTFEGGSTAFFAKLFEEVHTIDNNSHFLDIAKKELSSLQNIQFHLGSSQKVLTNILPSLKDRFILFYLDAHWENYWPLLDEIEAISKTHHQHCIIVVDDVKVPGRPDIPYDSYGEHECSYAYVKRKLEKTFDAYNAFYLIPADPSARAKLVVTPK